ncbi:g11498 [Coccomyxa elongata]
MGNSFCRFYCCCFTCESTPTACRMNLCCCHVGGGHVGSNAHADDVGETVIRNEKANINLCCCGLKVQDADVVHRTHPATQPTAASGASTKPGGSAPPVQDTYNPPPPAGYGNQVEMQQQAPPSAAAASQSASTQQPVMGYPAVQKKVVD